MSHENQNSLTRRQVIGGLGASFTAAAIAPLPAFAQGGAGVDPARKPEPLRDPKTKYVRPPFSGQSQVWPGLAGQMHPRPDHGETSYVGSGRLLGRKALITGGDSGMGRAAAIAYAREGADVAINYLPAEESDAREVLELIQAAGRIGLGIPGDLRDEAFCTQLVEQAVRGLGGLDIVVNNARFATGQIYGSAGGNGQP